MGTNEGLVLVVDDNDATRFAKSEVVRRAGFTVIEAETGRRALELAHQHPVDVVLLDVNLPDVSGIDVCARLKAADDLAAVQVLQISATAVTDEDRVRGLSGGADAYLVEPGSPDVMLATLRALLRVRRAEQDRAAALEREREARALAERATRAKDDFIAALSHELRTPLNTTFGWIAQLKTGQLDESQRTRAFEALDRSVRVQLRLINDLLDLASIRERKMRLEMSVVDLEALAAVAVDAARSEAQRKEVEISYSGQPARTLGDPTRLQQVVTNLLNNSIQYTPARGRICLTIAPVNGFAVIRVEDTGIGIDPELLPHVFDQFRQADMENNDHRGLGLGLAISRDIVELHGGTISAASLGRGRGSTFTVQIPIRRQDRC
jgi:two-component system, sensor histidine kinase